VQIARRRPLLGRIASRRASSRLALRDRTRWDPAWRIAAREREPRGERGRAAVFLDICLARLATQEARCRRALGELAALFCKRRSYQKLGFVRLSDWSRERLGLSASEIEAAGRVARGLRRLPRLAQAFEEDERISWTKVRLIVAIATAGDEESWVEIARTSSTRALEEAIGKEKEDRLRSVPDTVAGAARELASIREDDGKEIEGEPRACFRMSVPGPIWLLFRRGVEIARRMNGEEIPVWNAAEAIAAEGIAGAPRDLHWNYVLPVPRGARAAYLPPFRDTRSSDEDDFGEVARFLRVSKAELRELSPRPVARLSTAAEGLDAADLDRQMREVVRELRSIDWRTGRLLSLFFGSSLESEFGYERSEDYVREQLGMSLRRARCLLAIERRAERSPEIARAYREGSLSWLRTLALLPITGDERAVSAEWVKRAQQVTIRRLVDEVGWALEWRLAEADKESARPPSLGARLKPAWADLARDREVQVRTVRMIEFSAPASIVSFFRAAIGAWTEPNEPPWRGLERLLWHAIREWEASGKHRDPVFARDGWRCAVPGCTSRKNLHDHHMEFRSHGGGNERENRIANCAGHHLHGIHEGTVRCSGRAPDDVYWELGVLPDGRVLLRLHGDTYLEPAPLP